MFFNYWVSGPSPNFVEYVFSYLDVPAFSVAEPRLQPIQWLEMSRYAGG